MLLNYHIGCLVLSSLCVGDLVRLVLSGARFPGFSLQNELFTAVYSLRYNAPTVLYTTSCKHSLVLLRMGEIIARNMLS